MLRATEDGFLLALDSATGAAAVGPPDQRSSARRIHHHAAVVYDDLVFAGPAVSEFGVRGWIAAFHIADGTQAWRFNTVPAKGEPGAETWAQNAGVPLGGGTIWTALSLDPATETLFVSAGNPAPDLAVETRGGGANLYTNSVIALHARTGKLDLVRPDRAARRS